MQALYTYSGCLFVRQQNMKIAFPSEQHYCLVDLSIRLSVFMTVTIVLLVHS